MNIVKLTENIGWATKTISKCDIKIFPLKIKKIKTFDHFIRIMFTLNEKWSCRQWQNNGAAFSSHIQKKNEKTKLNYP